MLSVLAYGLAIAINLFIIFIGARFLLAPAAAASGYGVPSPINAYLSVKGVRDITYGLVGLALLAFVGAQAEAWFMLVVALAPFGDAAIVLRNGGTKATAFGVHFATAIVVLISAVLLFAV
jgi:hypothetical protein